jgi:hydroxypyruvate isomerase
MSKTQSRRSALQKMIAGAAAFSINPSLPFAKDMTTPDYKINGLKGNIRQSVCQWCFGSMALEDLCVAAKSLGLVAIDLIGPAGWDTLKKHGLDSSMCNGAEINLVDGFNEPKFHAQLIKNYTEMIPKVAAAGYKNLICFSGNRRGMDDKVGMKNCADGLKKLIPLAEKYGVILVMELLNSKIDHKDYMCDRTHWGVELCKMVGSENFKLLYDIYHMQIDEGDVIRTIRDSHQYIAHYHTAGVPGRNEIDETQELNYPAIMKAIVETGYKGYVAQEFIPTWKNPIAALAHSINTCDV